MAHTADYGQVKYRPMILQYSEILQYHCLFLKISLWHTDSIKFTIHAWPVLRQNIRQNNILLQRKWQQR